MHCDVAILQAFHQHLYGSTFVLQSHRAMVPAGLLQGKFQ